MQIQHDIASREIIRRHDNSNGRKCKEPLKKKKKPEHLVSKGY